MAATPIFAGLAGSELASVRPPSLARSLSISPEFVYLNPADGQCDKLLSAKTQELDHLGEHLHLQFSVADQYHLIVTGHEDKIIGGLLHCPFCRELRYRSRPCKPQNSWEPLSSIHQARNRRTPASTFPGSGRRGNQKKQKSNQNSDKYIGSFFDWRSNMGSTQ